MFFETPSPKYWAPVTYRQLDAEGNLVERKFDIEVKRLTATEMTARQNELVGKPGSDALMLAEVVSAFRVDEPKDGKPNVKVIEFKPETLASMEEICPGFIFACIFAFYNSRQPTNAAHHIAKN